MSIEALVDQVDELLDNAVSLPLSGGKVLVDAEKIHRLMDDIRLNLPKDIRSAEMIVKNRADIEATAKKEAEARIKQAEERARLMVAKDEITRQAQEKANELLAQARVKTAEIRKAANDYVDDLMQRTDESIALSLSELRKARQSIKSSQRVNGENK